MRKPWVAKYESKEEMLQFLNSIALPLGNGPIFVHPEYFEKLCERLGVKPEDILSDPPTEEE